MSIGIWAFIIALVSLAGVIVALLDARDLRGTVKLHTKCLDKTCREHDEAPDSNEVWRAERENYEVQAKYLNADWWFPLSKHYTEEEAVREAEATVNAIKHVRDMAGRPADDLYDVRVVKL